jgi:hypothetical protein
VKLKLREHVERLGPAPAGDLLYVIHDPTTGWSKFGISGRRSNDRLRAIRSRYSDLPEAEIVGVLATPYAAQVETFVYLAVRDHGGELVGEKFRGVRPSAVLRYARQIERDLRSMVEAFDAPARL